MSCDSLKEQRNWQDGLSSPQPTRIRDSVLEFALEQGFGQQFGEVGGDLDAAATEIEQLDGFLPLSGAEDEAHGRFFAVLALVFVQLGQI